jgi:hypothetical protein
MDTFEELKALALGRFKGFLGLVFSIWGLIGMAFVILLAYNLLFLPDPDSALKLDMNTLAIIPFFIFAVICLLTGFLLRGQAFTLKNTALHALNTIGTLVLVAWTARITLADVAWEETAAYFLALGVFVFFETAPHFKAGEKGSAHS